MILVSADVISVGRSLVSFTFFPGALLVCPVTNDTQLNVTTTNNPKPKATSSFSS